MKSGKGLVMKRKRSVTCETRDTETSKRIKPNESSRSGKNMVKYYFNLKRSGVVHRLMYYQDGEWFDFPGEIVSSVKEEFSAKKTAIELDIEGNKILLDFLHMVRVDLHTGQRQPIAWIDVSGKCFFPEIVGDQNEGDDIELHLELEIKGVDNLNGKENLADISDDHEGGGSCSHDSDAKTDENTISAAAPVNGLLDLDTVNELFIQGMSSEEQVEIVEISRCTSNALDSRLELFHKQVEIMGKFRGDANVVHAWLPCSRGMVSSVLNYGIGYPMNPMHGIHLTPANGTDISTSLAPDENGARHVVFCRVIVGNMELVPAGSNQVHPSSEDFDSGADDLQNPNRYTVWSMNVNSHVFPECVISYRVSSDVQGPMQESDSSGASSSEEEEPVVVNPSSPNCPVMPFSVLFAALKNQVSSSSMERVMANYELFSNNEIDRDEFIKKMRLIVGDALLKSIVKDIRSKVNLPN